MKRILLALFLLATPLAAQPHGAAQSKLCEPDEELHSFDHVTGLFACDEDATGAGDPCAAWPVGSVFIATVSTNPATLLGCGTWSAFGAGRVLVGLDAGQAEFDALGETGGAKTHALAEAEIPAHTHVQDAHSHGVTDPGHVHVENQNSATTGGLAGWGARDTSTNTSIATGYNTASATTGVTVDNATATNQQTGGGGAHNNLQPYITVAMWRRDS